VVHEDFPRAILPVGLFSDGHFFDMMMVVVKDSWLRVPKTKGEAKRLVNI
jgi:hypothetical protein